MTRQHFVTIGWFASNFIAIALLAFSDVLALRIVGWVWLSVAVSIGGLVEMGSITMAWWSTRSKH